MTTAAGLRLSVVIPTRDRPILLAAAVRSSLAALPDGSEVLVVDDRSSGPAAVGLPTDPRLRVLVNVGQSGAAGARNWGVGQAHGARILFLDDDDLLLPGYAAWAADQRADYGFSTIRTFRGTDTPALAAFVPGDSEPVDRVRPFRHQVAGLGCGFWIDRAAFLRVGGIAEDIRVNEDTEFSIRLLRAGLSGLRSVAPGVLVRQHGGASGQRGHLTHAAKAAERAGYFGLILERHQDWLTQRPDAARFLLQRRLKFLARAGDGDGARAALAHPLARPHLPWLRFYHLAEGLVSRIRRAY